MLALSYRVYPKYCFGFTIGLVASLLKNGSFPAQITGHSNPAPGPWRSLCYILVQQIIDAS